MPIERLPRKWQPMAYRLRWWAMQDNAMMLLIGVSMVLRGCSYVPVLLGDPPKSGTHPVEVWIDLHIIGWAWLLIGWALIVLSGMRRPRWDAHVLGVAVGLHVVWGCSFMLAMLGGEQPRGWVSAISYFTVALLIMWSLWRGKRGDMPTEQEWRSREWRRPARE